MTKRTLTSHVLDLTPFEWRLYTHRQHGVAIAVALERLQEYRVKAVIATREQLLAEIAPAPSDVHVGRLDELAANLREEIHLEVRWTRMMAISKSESNGG
jgi:hypothetical protein